MTTHYMASLFLCFRSLFPTQITNKRTTRMKGTTLGRIKGAGHFAAERRSASARRSGKKSMGIRVRRMSEQFVAGGKLHKTTEIHDRNTVTHEADDTEIVRNEQIAKPPFVLHVPEQIQHLSLYGGVKGGYWLIAYHQRRIRHQRSCHGNSLPLPAGKLMGKKPGLLRSQFHLLKYGAYFFLYLSRGKLRSGHTQRLGNGGSYSEPRVQGGKGILKNHLDTAGTLFSSI